MYMKKSHKLNKSNLAEKRGIMRLLRFWDLGKEIKKECSKEDWEHIINEWNFKI